MTLDTALRRPHDAVIRFYDEAGNVTETHEQVKTAAEGFRAF